MSEFVSSIKRQVGWFIILGIGAIVLIIIMITMRADIFANKFPLYFSPPSAAPFTEGQPVKFQGFTIGRINTISLDPDGKVRITLKILERYHSMLHQDSIIHPVRDGLIGEQSLEITAGDLEKPTLDVGQRIKYETAASIEQLLADVKPTIHNANTLIQELASLATWLNDPNNDFRQMGAHLNALSQVMDNESISTLITDLTQTMHNLHTMTKELNEAKVAEHLASSLHSTSEILSDLRPISQQIAAEGPENLAHINSLIRHVDQLSKSLDIVTSELSELTPELPGLARESRATIKEMRNILQNLQNSWLFGGDDIPNKSHHDLVAPPVLDMQP